MKFIKSLNILKYLLSHIDYLKKLKFIKYNKYLQEKLSINIKDYKTYKDRYIIYETKFRGKEYDRNNELIYEGEYLNGEKSGKGKEYFHGKVIFEGEFLRGKKMEKVEYMIQFILII